MEGGSEELNTERMDSELLGRKRRSSILKPSRIMLQDVETTKKLDDQDTGTCTKLLLRKRVSFADTDQIKEFVSEPHTWSNSLEDPGITTTSATISRNPLLQDAEVASEQFVPDQNNPLALLQCSFVTKDIKERKNASISPPLSPEIPPVSSSMMVSEMDTTAVLDACANLDSSMRLISCVTRKTSISLQSLDETCKGLAHQSTAMTNELQTDQCAAEYNLEHRDLHVGTQDSNRTLYCNSELDITSFHKSFYIEPDETSKDEKENNKMDENDAMSITCFGKSYIPNTEFAPEVLRNYNPKLPLSSLQLNTNGLLERDHTHKFLQNIYAGFSNTTDKIKVDNKVSTHLPLKQASETFKIERQNKKNFKLDVGNLSPIAKKPVHSEVDVNKTFAESNRTFISGVPSGEGPFHSTMIGELDPTCTWTRTHKLQVPTSAEVEQVRDEHSEASQNSLLEGQYHKTAGAPVAQLPSVYNCQVSKQVEPNRCEYRTPEEKDTCAMSVTCETEMVLTKCLPSNDESRKAKTMEETCVTSVYKHNDGNHLRTPGEGQASNVCAKFEEIDINEAKSEEIDVDESMQDLNTNRKAELKSTSQMSITTCNVKSPHSEHNTKPEGEVLSDHRNISTMSITCNIGKASCKYNVQPECEMVTNAKDTLMMSITCSTEEFYGKSKTWKSKSSDKNEIKETCINIREKIQENAGNDSGDGSMEKNSVKQHESGTSARSKNNEQTIQSQEVSSDSRNSFKNQQNILPWTEWDMLSEKDKCDEQTEPETVSGKLSPASVHAVELKNSVHYAYNITDRNQVQIIELKTFGNTSENLGSVLDNVNQLEDPMNIHKELSSLETDEFQVNDSFKNKNGQASAECQKEQSEQGSKYLQDTGNVINLNKTELAPQLASEDRKVSLTSANCDVGLAIQKNSDNNEGFTEKDVKSHGKLLENAPVEQIVEIEKFRPNITESVSPCFISAVSFKEASCNSSPETQRRDGLDYNSLLAISSSSKAKSVPKDELQKMKQNFKTTAPTSAKKELNMATSISEINSLPKSAKEQNAVLPGEASKGDVPECSKSVQKRPCTPTMEELGKKKPHCLIEPSEDQTAGSTKRSLIPMSNILAQSASKVKPSASSDSPALKLAKIDTTLSSSQKLKTERQGCQYYLRGRDSTRKKREHLGQEQCAIEEKQQQTTVHSQAESSKGRSVDTVRDSTVTPDVKKLGEERIPSSRASSIKRSVQKMTIIPASCSVMSSSKKFSNVVVTTSSKTATTLSITQEKERKLPVSQAKKQLPFSSSVQKGKHCTSTEKNLSQINQSSTASAAKAKKANCPETQEKDFDDSSDQNDCSPPNIEGITRLSSSSAGSFELESSYEGNITQELEAIFDMPKECDTNCKLYFGLTGILEKYNNAEYEVSKMNDEELQLCFPYRQDKDNIFVTLKWGDKINCQTGNRNKIGKKLQSISVLSDPADDATSKLLHSMFMTYFQDEQQLISKYPTSFGLLQFLEDLYQHVRRVKILDWDLIVTYLFHDYTLEGNVLTILCDSWIDPVTAVRIVLLLDTNTFPEEKIQIKSITVEKGPVSETEVREVIERVVPGRRYLRNIIVGVTRLVEGFPQKDN